MLQLNMRSTRIIVFDHVFSINTRIYGLRHNLDLFRRRYVSITKENMQYSTKATTIPDMSESNSDLIRNFSIIAHVDHGKSTLADRLLEISGTIEKSSRNKQVLDKLKVERDRGITIKAQTASMVYFQKRKRYLINMIDTPGHVDFSYEVNRSLAACQGILLVVDASQGVQSQTIANYYLAFSQNLAIIPVLNKIDLPHADVIRVKNQLQSVLDINPKDVIEVSAKCGLNVEKLFQAIVERIPPPRAKIQKDLTMLLFDSWYDDYKGDTVKSAFTKKQFEVCELGMSMTRLFRQAGQVGYIVTSMKNTKEAHIGDIFHDPLVDPKPLESLKTSKSMVFAGFYPLNGSDFEKLQMALDKLTLNDASVTLQKETSIALGQGFRIGFLGMLHMDVFQQRLVEEYGAKVITTSPCVTYKVKYDDGREEDFNNPSRFPVNDRRVLSVKEPYISTSINSPEKFLGSILSLCERRRGRKIDVLYLNDGQINIQYKLPLAEVAENHFFNELKHLTSGYASFDYDESHYEESDIIKLEVKLNDQNVDALARLIHRDSAKLIARSLAQKVRETIDRQQFELTIQILTDGKPVARETLKAYRKDVTAKCYGGDITRKRKLLEKQKEGKNRMRNIGRIELSHESYLALIRR